jgi:hypothetical protein
MVGPQQWRSQETARGAHLTLDLDLEFPSGQLIAPQIGGGLLAGAAALGAGYLAWHEHEKHKKTEEEVSSLLHLSDFPLFTFVEETSHPAGIVRDTHRGVPRAQFPWPHCLGFCRRT